MDIESFVPCRILMVDDERIVRDVVREVLDRPGWYLIEASDGETAIELLLKEPFDLLITDKNLPGITGLDVIRRAKAVDPMMGTLLITAFASRESVEEAMAIGVDDYLVKPFDISDLFVKVIEAQKRREEKHRSRSSTRSTAPLLQTGCRVMICTSEESTQRVLSEAVRILGHHPALAASPAEILPAVSDKKVEAVICDLDILIQNNSTACFLRSVLILSKQLKFVVLTENRKLESAISALRQGAGKMLYHPLGGAERVAETLKNYLGGSPSTPDRLD
jgi:DNA-binding NtrC family response regulator